MYIDFEDYRPDVPRVERAISVREGVLISIIVHLLAFIVVIFLPPLDTRTSNPLAARLVQPPQESPRFVFMAPKADISKPQPKTNVEASDQDRVASSIERAPDPKNSLPFARGNTPERVEADPQKPGERADVSQQAAAPQSRQDQQAEAQMAANDAARSLPLPQSPNGTPALSIGRSGGVSGQGVLGDALRNLQRYTQQQSFDNPQGSGDGQGLIQFDSKGVEFGPWIRRFIAQVKRNWFIPSAAMLLKGHVVVTFNVHKDGSITDVEVKTSSGTDSFDRAAANALIASNPTQPLPPEYPSEAAFFTVTFLYNEMAPQ